MIDDASDIAYRIESVTDARLTSVCEAVNRTFRNGGVILRCLRPTLATDPAFSESRDDCVRRFLSSPSVSRLIPELRPLSPLPDDLIVVPLGRYTLEGEIVQLLLADGMHAESQVDHSAARRLAREFVDALLGNQGCSVHRVDGHWADWFDGIEWNRLTLVVYTDRRWWLLCAFDTD